ncbi:uncharacterized protein B0I36DRAFT_344631 [Microdochium trichocladiopsis]|uniref:Uncharacterized protein n=1 Tax=Microdochium trichocladiopsis TaxID=1682393 RepID=A0A9P8YFW1_9PEZI|nr:uncharacterized protein B0I36DRAFT_344631 [Microdochium trichocladiopsis]KAH7040982.1 hypothetical protein B0I36DRAFT_344631 [Microdochium trichocladiopsis]
MSLHNSFMSQHPNGRAMSAHAFSAVSQEPHLSGDFTCGTPRLAVSWSPQQAVLAEYDQARILSHGAIRPGQQRKHRSWPPDSHQRAQVMVHFNDGILDIPSPTVLSSMATS